MAHSRSCYFLSSACFQGLSPRACWNLVLWCIRSPSGKFPESRAMCVSLCSPRREAGLQQVSHDHLLHEWIRVICLVFTDRQAISLNGLTKLSLSFFLQLFWRHNWQIRVVYTDGVGGGILIHMWNDVHKLTNASLHMVTYSLHTFQVRMNHLNDLSIQSKFSW